MIGERIANILNSASRGVHRLLDLDRFYVALYDPVRNEIEFPLVVVDGAPLAETQAPWERREYQGTGQVPDCLIEREEPLLLDTRVAEQLQEQCMRCWPDGQAPRSWLGVRIVHESQVIGALVAENRAKEGAFGDNGARVLSTVARQTAMAIANARLYVQLERQIENLEAVYKVGQDLTSKTHELGEKEILELIYEQASRLMETENLYIALYEPDPAQLDTYDPKRPRENEIHGTVDFRLMYVDGAPASVPSRKAGRGRTEWIIRHREPILILTREASVQWYEEKGEEYIGEPFASWLGVPMVAGDQVVGVIATYHKTDDYVYDQEDLRVLSLMAGQAAIALQNVRLLAEQERRSKEIWEALGQVTAGLIHKMSNSLGLVPTWTEEIEEALDPLDEDTRESIRFIRDGASDVLSYTNDMAKILRMKSINKEPADIKLVIEDALAHAIPLAQEQGILVHKPYDTLELPEVYVSPALVGEVFQNLLRNAVQAMPSGGEITIGIEKIRGEGLLIKVEDTGSGIPKEKWPNVFQVGFSSKQEGRGIGLWFCKTVVEQHDGNIKFDSEEGVGTTFSIFLPKGHPTSPSDLIGKGTFNVQV